MNTPYQEAPNLVSCSEETHAAPILEILNQAIVDSTAIYDYKPRPPSSMAPWFRAKVASNFPVLGLEASDGQLLGFATYGTFRAWPAYKYTVEHPLYVRHDMRGRGFGGRLLGALIEVAQARDVHVLVAGIDASNQASIALHEKHGFRHVGIVRECGFKFGRWLDLAFFQLQLETPRNPVGDP
jgi:L-amino acid N-acyltransferase YncA